MRATCLIDRLQTEVSIVPPLLPDCHLPLSPSHTDDTETDRVQQPGRLVFQLSVNKNNTPHCADTCLQWVSQNLMSHGVMAIALSAGPERDRDTNVRKRDGSETQTGGSGKGAGELLAGTGGRRMA